MFGKKRIYCIAAFATITFFVVFVLRRDTQPQYGGRVLSEWLSIYENALVANDPAVVNESAEAIRGIGTNGIPNLIRWLNTSNWEVAAADLSVTVADKVNRAWIPDDTARARQERVVYAFEILGTNGAPAVQQLTQLARGKNQRVAAYATRCLTHIGAADVL